jgi:hypothetical protein
VAEKNKKQKGGRWGARLFLVVGILMAAILLPSTVLLLVGMLPTVVAFLVDRSRKKNKAFTVGSLNLAGCTPFLLDLWMQGHSFDQSMVIISNPTAIVVMYSAAAVGYVIDWAMSGLVANVLYQRGQARSKAIRKQREELIERWGKEVTGEEKLDQHGFPVQEEDHKQIIEN